MPTASELADLIRSLEPFEGKRQALLADQPLPTVAEAIFGPWRIWFDPPPIGTRNCDWHYQHEDAEPEGPAWMHGHCASREACIAEIIDAYEAQV